MPNGSRPFYPQGNTRLIETDPQIVKVGGAAGERFMFEWGSRPSFLKNMTGNAAEPGGAPSQPNAPEMVIKHTG